MKQNRIYLSPPHMNGKEMDYIKSAFEINRIAPLGENVDLLESMVGSYTGASSAVALSSGTAAIHLGLKYLGVGPGDRVFCSDATFSASCNPISYLMGEPVFIDSDEESWNISPLVLERAMKKAKEAGKLPKALVVVDLYGHPANYDKILPICEKYGVPILEDAAEALGTTYRGRMCGTFGQIGVLSFNGNKIITTSGGGMLLTDNKDTADKVKFWATQAREPALHYEHKEIGYNYRLSNICAGIGCGQMETIKERVDTRKKINEYYKKNLSDLPVSFAPSIDGGKPNFWLTVIRIETPKVTVLDIINALNSDDIESRPFWKPMHMQTVFSDCEFYSFNENSSVSVGEKLFLSSVCLPSGSALTQEQQDRIVAIIRGVFKEKDA